MGSAVGRPSSAANLAAGDRKPNGQPAAGTMQYWMQHVNLRVLEDALKVPPDSPDCVRVLELDECAVAMDLLSLLLAAPTSSVRELRLRHTGALSEVASLLRMDPPLERLSVDGDDGLDVVTVGVSASSVGAAAVMGALSMNRRLRHLRLASIDMAARDVRALSALLRSNACPALRVLHVVDAGLGDEGAAALLDALGHNRHLKELSLDANGIGDGGVAGLPAALESNRALTALSLRLNAVVRVPVLPGGMCLRRLVLHHNPGLVCPPPHVVAADEDGRAAARFFRLVRARQARESFFLLLCATHQRDTPIGRSLAQHPLYDPSVWYQVADFLPASTDGILGCGGPDAQRGAQRAGGSGSGGTVLVRQFLRDHLGSCVCSSEGAVRSPRPEAAAAGSRPTQHVAATT